MCDRQISTESGVLTCDKKSGHTGAHHSKHPGGLVLDPYGRKKSVGSEELMTVEVPPLEIEWPQEGMNDPVKMMKG